MHFRLLQNYGPVDSGMGPINEWSPADIQNHIEFQIALNQELGSRGELVDAARLAINDTERRYLQAKADESL